MAQTTVYIKAERNTQMQTDDVFLKDIASLYCIHLKFPYDIINSLSKEL